MSLAGTFRERAQQTLERTAVVQGVGFLTGADVTLRFLPADPDHGIVFERTDCRESEPVPATIEYTVPRERRTAISHQGVTVEMTEHVLAALAGLQIDNCRVQLDAPEPPGGDGSSQAFTEALLKAGSVTQDAVHPIFVVDETLRVTGADGHSELIAKPSARAGLAISYQLDYGPRSPIRPQTLSIEITPENFVNGLSFARTFILESEIDALRAQGYGSRTTTQDLLVFGADGVIDNDLRAADECVRHKILDCLGDFALMGCDIHGHFEAYRSGHSLNREVVRSLKQSRQLTNTSRVRQSA